VPGIFEADAVVRVVADVWVILGVQSQGVNAPKLPLSTTSIAS